MADRALLAREDVAAGRGSARIREKLYFSQRPAGQTAQSINMAVLVLRIHDGVNGAADGP